MPLLASVALLTAAGHDEFVELVDPIGQEE
jgi:hypothetical protein